MSVLSREREREREREIERGREREGGREGGREFDLEVGADGICEYSTLSHARALE